MELSALEQVLNWCEEHAPVTFGGVQSPAQYDEIAEAERSSGVSWVPELRALFSVANGTRRHDRAGQFRGTVLPYSDLLSVQQVEHVRRQALLAESELGWGDQSPDNQSAAGSVTGFYSPAFIPFSALDSDYQWVVDLRAGAMRGSICRFDIENKDTGALWSSLDQLFEETLYSVSHNTPLDRSTPTVTDGVLTWT